MVGGGYLDASSHQSSAFQHSTVSPKKRIRRCASTPTLSCCSNDLAQKGLEVYVAFRPFTEFGGALFAKLPASVKDNLLGLGIAHYMTVFRTPDGRYTQFDFGPQGGRDIYMSAGSLDKLMTPDQPRSSGKRSVPGEVRENQVQPFLWSAAFFLSPSTLTKRFSDALAVLCSLPICRQLLCTWDRAT